MRGCLPLRPGQPDAAVALAASCPSPPTAGLGQMIAPCGGLSSPQHLGAYRYRAQSRSHSLPVSTSGHGPPYADKSDKYRRLSPLTAEDLRLMESFVDPSTHRPPASRNHPRKMSLSRTMCYERGQP